MLLSAMGVDPEAVKIEVIQRVNNWEVDFKILQAAIIRTHQSQEKCERNLKALFEKQGIVWDDSVTASYEDIRNEFVSRNALPAPNGSAKSN